MAADPQVFELKCPLQEYAWGKQGDKSLAATLKTSADHDFRIDPSKHYAELWMGTHPNGPSMVMRPGQQDIALWEWVHENPDSLGSEVKNYFKNTLPFLFKVLSVRTALSVQAHPNKVQAELLHKKFPDLYRDSNHKPELAIALTEFQGLCGFRPIEQIASFIQKIEELRAAVGSPNVIKLITASRSSDMPLRREAIKDCFSYLIEGRCESVKTALKCLVEKVHDMKERGDCLKQVEGDVIMKLDKEFPGDIGAFCVYFLNVVRLDPGDAMFLEANMPHAYLFGDCMECSACSDNVVRAGLTHKFIDKHTLVEMLDYKPRHVNNTKFMGIEDEQEKASITIFRPDVPDFGVTRYKVPGGVKQLEISGIDSASICIVIHGEGMLKNKTVQGVLKLCPGTVFFMAALQEANVQVMSKDGMIVFRAYAGLLPFPENLQQQQFAF
ncbi:mannose-6-phosphate isomerase-like [Babylonia areolata]|uniref:mannose-6-phosphate isomerase-like n=1 Tax=Babylonia areolata TaxID=304850 RepID=UPI003FCFACC4